MIASGGPEMVVDSWLADHDTLPVHVTKAMAERRPSFVIVTTRDGALGFEWISNVALPP